jgi:hypothetical protein
MSADGKLEWRLLGETGGTLLLVAAKSAFQRFLQLAGDFAGRGLHRTLHDVAGFGERLVECFFDCRLADSREVMGCRDENREKGMTGWLDAHPHYVTEHYAKECRAAGHAHPDGMPGLPDWSVAAALDVMGRAGIGTAVLSVSSPGVHLGNDSLAESRAARGPGPPCQRWRGKDRRQPSRWRRTTTAAPSPTRVCPSARRYGRSRRRSDAAPDVLAGRGAHDVRPASPMIEFLFDTTRCVVDLALSGTLAATRRSAGSCRMPARYCRSWRTG